MRNLEAEIQVWIGSWLRATTPDTVRFAVLNDGLYSKQEASKRRWMALLAGIPELILLAPGGRTFGLEVKRPGGMVSTEQCAKMTRMNSLGVSVAMVRSLEDACNALRAWGVPFEEGDPPEGLPEAQARGERRRRVFPHTTTNPRAGISRTHPVRA